MASGPVLINARAATRPELGGVERWAREMAARLPQLDPAMYEVVRPPRQFVHRAGHAWEQAVLPAYAARRRASLLLNPANLAPLAFGRNVVVIHDAAALREPGWYSRLYVTWQRAVLPALARRALHLVTVSQFSRHELVELLGADPENITVIPGGVDERFGPGIEPARRSRPYVITVASRTARKNLAALEQTARRLAREGVDLVAVGGDRPQFRGEGAVGGDRPQFRGEGAVGGETAGGEAAGGEPGDFGLIWLGHVDDDELPALYAGAEAFVLPSHYEGFGLTVLEAMAVGTPVVASNVTALPELVGDAGILVDPHDPAAIADAIERARNDDDLGARGAERARAFTWAASAEAVHGLLERLRHPDAP